ncbi:MAG: AAA family ATPase, partial [Anaerolineae bacterium]
MDVEAWLRGLGLEQYAEAFSENHIDAETLGKLTEEDLRDIGVTSVGHRRKLLDAIAHLGADSGAAVVGSEDAESAAEPKAERRQLTVMFCDLVGSTPLAERLDPEEIRGIIRAYQNSVAGEIARYDGHVAQFMGDGVLAYFGWPTAHEDDAERAVRSGLSVIDAVARLVTPSDEALQVRLGIATGLVVVDDLIGKGAAAEQAAVGGTPNLAARLQGLAAPNTAVIAASTRDLLGERFEYEDLGRHDLRGISDPVQVWRVVRPIETESRFVATRGAHLTPLVGREEELDLLRRRWAQVQQGKGHVVLLTGEAGIGKSRTAHALLGQIAKDPHVRLLYQCSPYHTNSALYPFIRQLEGAAGFVREDSDEQKLDKLEALLAKSTSQVHEVAALIAALLSIPAATRYPPLAMSPQKQKEEILCALVDQLASLAAQQPVLFVFEDSHWVDPTSQELLDLIVDRVQPIPILVLITFRPEYSPLWSRQAHVTLLALSRLNHDLGVAMVRELSGRKRMPKEVLEQILIKTDGIPLFIEELTKTVLDSGLLLERADHYALAGRLPEHAIPTTLKDSLMARLDQLGPIKEVAQIGATIGRGFSYPLLSLVSGYSDNTLNTALERLTQSQLVFERGTRPHASYLFKHALVQDAAYESLLKSRRQQLHARIAQIIEDNFPEQAEVEPELLAHHYTEAKLPEPAMTYWRRAGERAVARSAHVEAIGHLKKGLTLLRDLPDGPDRARYELSLQSALGPPLIATQGYGTPEVEKVYTRAREVWREVGDPAQLCPILYGLWMYYITKAEYQTARTLCADLLNAAESARDAAFLLDAHVALSVTSFFVGEFDPAREHAKRGMTLFDPQRHRSHALQNPGVVCRIVHAVTSWYLGYPEQALTTYHDTLSLARDLSHPFSLAVALTWFAMLHQYRRDAREARALAEEAMAISSEQSFPNWHWVAAMVRGWALVEQGLEEEGLAQVRECAAPAEATGARIWQPYRLSLLAEAYEKAGQTDEAQQALAEALTVARNSGERYWEAELHRLAGMLLLAGSNNDPAEAEACFKKAIDVARTQGARSLELRTATSLARLWRD